jgi:hypothetical protein
MSRTDHDPVKWQGGSMGKRHGLVPSLPLPLPLPLLKYPNYLFLLYFLALNDRRRKILCAVLS